MHVNRYYKTTRRITAFKGKLALAYSEQKRLLRKNKRNGFRKRGRK